MDDAARMDTPAHRLDARAKAVVTAVFIVAVMSFPPRDVSALTPFMLYPIFLISLGRIPLRLIFTKILVAAPFALAVGVFNPLLDRQPVGAVGPFVVTGGGVSFVSIMLRFILTVGAALALVACTGMYRLCAGMEEMGVPRAFAMQLLFLYRYLFVVADQGAKMMRSVNLRSGGAHAIRFRVYVSLIGHLLLRSMDRAGRVYRAMAARGFNGEIRLLRRTRFGGHDLAFICGWLAFFLAIRIWNPAGALAGLFKGIVP